jgi:hypothetical protein
MPTTMRRICSDALTELNVLGAGETMSAEQADLALGKLQRLFNNWNAERRAVYAAAFLEFTLTPSLLPHTIGPTGATFSATIRPVSIDGAYLILNTSSPAVNLPITVRDVAWWREQTVPDLTSSVPTDLYYEPTFPNGSLYFWPVPTVAYGVGLQARVLLDDTITLDQSFNLPPGYQDATTLTLAEMLVTTFGRDMPPLLPKEARDSRARVFANNDQTPRLMTADYGMQGASGNPRPTWNYLDGSC